MRLRATLACLGVALLAACTRAPVGYVPPAVTVSLSTAIDMPGTRATAARRALADAGFVGTLATSDGERDFRFVSIGEPVPGPDPSWPWASVTKQVLATLAMQQVEAGLLDLDAPAARYLPALAGGLPSPTVRQLLQHRSGLRNPDDSAPDADGFPSFYSAGPTGLDWCLAGRGEATPGWRYNNCDYIVLGALLENVVGVSLDALIRAGIGEPAGWTGTRPLGADDGRAFVGRDPAYAARLPRFGSSAALVGPLADMLRFDRALLDGRLLGEDARAMLWAGDGALGFMALGQWSFTAPLAGCAAPVRIVERRGGIGKYELRNVMLPERGLAIVLATANGPFAFGEIWQGAGPMHDTLAALACG